MKTKRSQAESIEQEINILDQLISNYFNVSVDSAGQYIGDYFKKANKLNNHKYIYQAHAHASRYYWMKSESDSVIKHLENSLFYAKALENLTLQADTYRRMSMFYDYQGDMQQSIAFAEKASEKALLSNDWDLISRTLLREGNLNYRSRKYPEAIKAYHAVDSIITSNDTINDFLGSALLNIGLIYTYLDNQKAEDYLKRALALYSELNYQEGIANTKINLVSYYERRSIDMEVLKLAKEAQEFYRNYGDVVKDAFASEILANCFLALNNLDSAKLYYEHSLSKAIDSNQPDRIAKSYVGMAKYAFKSGQHQMAIDNYKKAIDHFSDIMEAFTLHEKVDIYEGLSQSYLEKGDYKKAYAHIMEFVKWQDSLSARANNRLVSEIEAKYQTEKKQKQIELLAAQNALEKQQRATQFYIFIAALVFIIIVLAVVYSLYRNRQKVARKLSELDQTKSKFFANISHEFRTPLTLIKGPVHDQLSQPDLNESSQSNLEMIDKNADRLLKLVDQLLDLSKLESGNMKLNIEQGSLLALLRGLVSSFNYTFNQRQISLNVEMPTAEDQSFFDQDIIEKIVNNLLSNALKYTPKNGYVDFTVSLEAGKVDISVRNSGPGIRPEQLNQISKRFYQADANSEGVGIGLALIKELVQLHCGVLSIDSEEGKFATFKVSLPVAHDNFRPEDIIPEAPTQSVDDTNQLTGGMFSSNGLELFNNDQELPLMLIVEDNTDVRQLVKNTFSCEFKIIEAENGKEGVQSALEFIPDIIISDIMMPVKDGVELSQTLKADEKTCHIPIILLTAKAGERNEIIGLETGADDYIVKPFNKDVLRIRVKKLIELRATLRKRYSQEVILKPKDIAITPTDEKFLKKVQDILDEKLTEPNFTTEIFSKEIGMSRMQLHRKLKAIVGLSATEFIRSQRLKAAAHLLSSTDTHIAEVGYAVGFNDPSYFAKCFKEVYGCSPTQFSLQN
ncbi:ATP-binding protein [Fulvivirga aurantia]|uniref:ATP-binding protein n=1 Tax=Fulvivirga aurantia TaxID=2529383 RepID=UPI0016296194|nr:ATP-binding protein [Fulvivirga aurantia]